MSSTSTLFPYTTLFRSIRGVSEEATCGAQQLQPLLLSGPQMNPGEREQLAAAWGDRKSTRLNSSHVAISYAVFCLKKKKITTHGDADETELEYVSKEDD